MKEQIYVVRQREAEGGGMEATVSGQRRTLVVCVIPFRLHYSLISGRATQPERTGPQYEGRFVCLLCKQNKTNSFESKFLALH